MQFFRHDQIECAQRRLVQRRQQHSANHQRNEDSANHFKRLLQIEPFEHDRGELQPEHSGIKHHAICHFKHHRMWVAHDEWMPDAIRPSQVKHQRHANQEISEKSRQDRWTYDRAQSLNVQDVDGRGEGESTCR